MNNIGVEVALTDEASFLKIKETLTRIGIAQPKTSSLYQTCHILFKRGRYYIVHFKEMFILDGRPVTFDTNDLDRRDVIAFLLEEWNLCRVITDIERPAAEHKSLVYIIPYRDKTNWNLIAKYTIGRKS